MANKTTSSEELEQRRHLRVGFLIHDVSRLRRTVYDQHLKPLGITRSQWWVLSNLSRHDGDGYMQVELARLLDVGKVTLGGLIDRLEDSGFVIRVPDKNDRRSKRVLISPKGAEVLKQIESVSRKLNNEILKEIAPEDEEKFAQLLAKMKSNLIEMEALPVASKASD
ncbi:MarR family transcriptional regulator [Spongiibacter taiwanensis]|uniref:MarR family winged helix-turn-helix transcriptional regulator n=1 Tax=Spongiibacter taiwanensis TaxID=1748242 RepID=UPI002034B6AF|nr:MarR family transcriptional regulator [Spongiibacter taiwanensis]USA42726.1 MarR family transcriptional regulator [Spongiibacter taiwanensis]